jgi:hypothetical protein
VVGLDGAVDTTVTNLPAQVGAVSLDSRWLTTSNATGRTEIYVQPFGQRTLQYWLARARLLDPTRDSIVRRRARRPALHRPAPSALRLSAGGGDRELAGEDALAAARLAAQCVIDKRNCPG